MSTVKLLMTMQAKDEAKNTPVEDINSLLNELQKTLTTKRQFVLLQKIRKTIK